MNYKSYISQPGEPMLKISGILPVSQSNSVPLKNDSRLEPAKREISSNKQRGKRQLSERDASVARAMLIRGDKQHDIAAWFGVNGGRIAEIASYKSYPEIMPFKGKLPPRGPYDVRKLHAQREAARRKMTTASLEIQNVAASLENCLPAEVLRDKKCKKVLSRFLNIASGLETPL